MKRIDMGGGVMIETPFLTIEEAAEYLGISINTFKKIASDKKIPCTMLSEKSIRFHCEVLCECMERYIQEYATLKKEEG